MKYNAVIFDLDGTLLDTIGDLGAAVNYALGLHGLPLHAMGEFPAMVGHGTRNLTKTAIPAEYAENEELISAVLKDFTAYYTDNIDVFTRPYEGIADLLSELQARGAALAVASNKFQAGVEKLMGRFFPDIKWASLCGNTPGAALKPDPSVVEGILRQMSENSNYLHPVLVGDSGTDIQTALSSGIPSIGVTWGYRPESSLAGAGLVARSVGELAGYLL